MSLIQLEKSTPPVYSNNSRDFQLICRTYDSIINGVKFDIDSIPSILDTSNCRDNIIELLQTKLGFFTKNSIDINAIRQILSAFPRLMKYKGSMESILEAIYIFLRIEDIEYSAETMIDIDNTNYIITISFNTDAKIDFNILYEIFRYILPTGYFVKLKQVKVFDDAKTLTALSHNIWYLVGNHHSSSLVKAGKKSYLTKNLFNSFNCRSASKKTAVFNLWDEQWESGSYDNTTGNTIDNANSIRSKNFIPVTQSKSYYFKAPQEFNSICYYNSSKQFISSDTNMAQDILHTAPSTAAYVTFSIGSNASPITEYDDNICINRSQTDTSLPWKNGDYMPYKEVDSGLVVNSDGSLSVTNYIEGVATVVGKLSTLCPDLKVGDTATLSYTSSFTNSRSNSIYLNHAGEYWKNGDTKTITQEMIDDATVSFYSGGSTSLVLTTTFSNIQIELGDTATSYAPYSLLKDEKEWKYAGTVGMTQVYKHV